MSAPSNGPVAQTRFTVYDGGLSEREQRVLHGVLHLTEHNPVQFAIEADFLRADILLLDGRGEIDFDAALRARAHRIVWIDTPDTGRGGHHIARPIHWLQLMQLLERAAGGTARSPAAAPSLDDLLAVCGEVLRRHIGAAGEFVVEDLRVEFGGRDLGATGDKQALFAAALQAQLPRDADAELVLREVVAAAKARGSAHPPR